MLDLQKAVRALLEDGGFNVAEFEIIVPPSPVEEDWSAHGASAIPEVQKYYESLSQKQRNQASLPLVDGPLYCITDDSVARNPGPVGEVLRQNQNHIWAAMQDHRMFTVGASYVKVGEFYEGGPQELWSRVIAFSPGIKDADVLEAIKYVVDLTKNTNPQQKFPGI